MTETDWMWVHENPKEAAATIDRLRAEIDLMKSALEKIVAFETHPYSMAKATLERLRQ